MNNVLMVWVSEDLRGGECVISLETVVVKRRGAENIVWLLEKPGHLGAWEDNLRFAGDVGQDVG